MSVEVKSGKCLAKGITKLKMKCPRVFYRDVHHGDIKNSFIAVCIKFQIGLRLTFQKSTIIIETYEYINQSMLYIGILKAISYVEGLLIIV